MYVSEISAINVPFTFYCACGTAEEIALVDSGAMENFMDNQMVERLGIRKWEMTTPHRVFNVDGSKNKQGILTHYRLLRVKKGKEEDLQQFYITSLGRDRAILGYPWLHRFCYAQALGVVGVGSLSVERSWRIKVRSGRPSCRASQGQNHGVRRDCRGSGEVRQSA